MKGHANFNVLEAVNRLLVILFAGILIYVYCPSSMASSQDTNVVCNAEPAYDFSMKKDNALILRGAGEQNVYDFLVGDLLLYDGQELTASLSGGTLLHRDGVHTLEYTLSFSCDDPISYLTTGNFPINITVNWAGCISGLYTAPLVLTVKDKTTGETVWQRKISFQAYMKENHPHDDGAGSGDTVPTESLVTLTVVIVNGDTGEVTHNNAIVKNGDIFVLRRSSAMLFQLSPNEGYYVESVTLNGETIFCPITGGLISTGLLAENSTLEIHFQSRELNPPRTGDRDALTLVLVTVVWLLLLLLLILRRKRDRDGKNGRDGLYSN